MPDVLHRLPTAKKKNVANAIAAYLSAGQLEPSKPSRSDNKKSIATGQELFHSIGCVACHSPRDKNGHETLKGSVPLGDLSAKYFSKGLTQFLFEPHTVRPSGRMPDMKLTKDEAQSLAAYLLSSKTKTATLPKAAASLIKEGQKYFTEFNCAACHQRSGHSPVLSKKMADLKNADCKGPAYTLTPTQKTSIQSSLLNKTSLSDADKITQKFATFNCFACHQRDGLGGVSELRNQYFTSEEPELGITGRIPPPLTNVGAKLQKNWLHKVLVNGESVRHYMHTRMPQFGSKQMAPLINLLDKVDKVAQSGLTDVSKEEKKEFRTAGRKMVGIEGNNCISCHNYNGLPSLGLKALDIFSTAERLKPDWFYHYMINPAAHRPGTVMPSFWPGGKSLRQEILAGSTKDQLRAMWYYFTLGQTQRTPKGLIIEPVILTADKEIKIYRGRSRNSGFRGIAIGFPEGLNISFDAEHMTYTSLWQGKFIQVNWRGQASGNYNPAERALRFNTGISFAKIKVGDPWPERAKRDAKGKDKENPDPLFVRRHGLQFKGYYIVKKTRPIFMYRLNDIKIEDSWTASDKQTLTRLMSFDAPSKDSYFYRLASTELIKKISDQKYRINDSFEVVLQAPHKFIQNGKDLLIKLNIPAGKSQVTITYRGLK
jgi:mono/diheme cytochrome c family protein